MLNTGFQMVLRAIYPPACLVCGGEVAEEFGICGPCWRDTPFVGGPTCRTCDAPVLGEGDPDAQCEDCSRVARPWATGTAALYYRGNARTMVLAMKHGDRHEVAKAGGVWMKRRLDVLEPNSPLIVPVPLHWSRLIKRRFNQSALLAKSLASAMNTDWCPDLLLRTKRTRSLDGMNREAREDEVRDAITVNPKRKGLIGGRSIIVVDDVMTTGATLAACVEALSGSQAGEFHVAVLARVAKDA